MMKLAREVPAFRRLLADSPAETTASRRLRTASSEQLPKRLRAVVRARAD
jgi:hypothetical protein